MKRVAVIVFCAYFVAVFSIVGYAFGFFSASTSTGDAEAQFGKVALEVGENTLVQAVDWTGMFTAHMELEQKSDIINGGVGNPGAIQYALDQNFTGWWSQYEESLDSFFKSGAVASPGGFIVKEYSFINESTLPVYFRIEKPSVTIAGEPDLHLAVATLAWETSHSEQKQSPWNYNSTKDTLLADGGSEENWLYLQRPIEVGEEYRVTFVLYILGNANDNVFQGRQIVFTVGCAELIQAQNNAVNLDDDWKQAVENGVSFIPYTENNN